MGNLQRKWVNSTKRLNVAKKKEEELVNNLIGGLNSHCRENVERKEEYLFSDSSELWELTLLGERDSR